MAPRRVIADSDDDDDDDDDFSPVKTATDPAPVDPPFVMEPSSPHHQPTDTTARQPSPCAAPAQENTTHTSDSTDPSFFAQVYDEQQARALRHAQLVENIVRESQRVSRNSGEVLLPAKSRGRGKAINTSSATDVTSPVISRKPHGRGRLLQMSDTTEVTTPRKSAGKDDEWDVPSSEDEAPVTQGGRSSKKGHLSLSAADGPTSQDTGNFYVAQSNLTTSQKLEYRKVQVPDEPSGETTIQDSAGQMQPPPNQKSSCATTIAYSTPSRYASSGPRPPWETAAPAEVSAESRGGAVDLTMSSPDAITSAEAKVAASGSKSQQQVEESESPVKKVSRKRRQSEFQGDEDELGQDESSDAIGYHRETYRPQKSRRRLDDARVQASEANFDPEEAEYPREDDEDRISDLDPEYGQTPPRAKGQAKSAAESSSKQSLTAASEGPQPKKRGRKKKQPVVEEVLPDEDAGAQETGPVPALVPTAATETVPAEKPRRKRGRPRKSEAIKDGSIGEQGSDETQGNKEEEALLTPQRHVPEENNVVIDDSWKRAAADASMDGENVQQGSAEAAASPKKSASPLKDADSNALLTSQSTTTSISHKTSTSDKSTTTVKVTPSHPGKMGYRVGLSKRSRIAPLLKSLKK